MHDAGMLQATTDKTRSASAPSRRRARLALHGLFGVIGLIALGLLVRSAGARNLLTTLRIAARWLPLLLALDVLRIGCEALGTFYLSRLVRRVPMTTLARIHLIGYSVGAVMPAGRSASEAVKATMLAGTIGAPRAAAIAATNQGLSLLSGALCGLPCAAAAYGFTGISLLTLAIMAYSLIAGLGFLLVQMACRRRELGGMLGRRFARVRAVTGAFHSALAEIPVVPGRALFMALLGRLLQAIELGILVFAVGGAAGIGATFLSQGVSLVGGSLGDLIPGQFGAADGAFALAAPTLGISAAAAISVSLMVHCLQIFWALFGAVAPLFFRAWTPSFVPVGSKAKATP